MHGHTNIKFTKSKVKFNLFFIKQDATKLHVEWV